MKALVLTVALGVSLSAGMSSADTLSSGTAAKNNDVQLAAVPAPAAVSSPVPAPLLRPSQPGPWRITKTEWSRQDEDGFGEFLRAIAKSGCTTTISCMQSAANFYHDSDPPAFEFHADCAKWAYMLRAYYASKNGLPFSYVNSIAGNSADLRYGETSNMALTRRDIVDSGTGIDTEAVLRELHDKVWTATYRMDASAQSPVEQDFYSPKIQPGSIRAGTAIYDTTGHVMIVYDVSSDGIILYMDAHPDETVSRGMYGAHVPRSPMQLGGGFKDFRPIKLVDAELRPDGTYVGGHIVPAPNEEIADFSLEQYRGNATSADTPIADASDSGSEFRYNNAPLTLYEYARASMSNGGFTFNPVYEIEFTMGSLCRDAKAGTRDGAARVDSGFTTLYLDLLKTYSQWNERDLRMVYHGVSLKQTLNAIYAAQQQACVVATPDEARSNAGNPLDPFVRRESAAAYIPILLARINDYPPFYGMHPVGN